MKVNVTMFKKVPGSEKPVLDFLSVRARSWNDALRKAMEAFKVTGEEMNGAYLPIHDIDGEFVIGEFRTIAGGDLAEYRFLLEEDDSAETEF
ncbi:MAG: hypothetical protein J6X69_01450 [Bacteroidales bacterium]|nr:hypothetical protein [Bacteroidales bacterium]MBP5779655.1 hypothetical protein [Clostridia bacterium]